MLIELNERHLTADFDALASFTWGAYAPDSSPELQTPDDGWHIGDEELLRYGYPCAVAFGREVADVPDPTVDVHAFAVRNIDRERLRRELRALPALERLVTYLLCGIGCSRHQPREVGELTGQSDDDVLRTGRRALAALSARGVDVAA